MNAMENWKSPCVVDIACPIVVWLRDTFVADADGRVPKDDVYKMYKDFSDSKGWATKRNSDFGKVIKKAFPEVTSRRLGSAGKQISHYSGISLRDPMKQPQHQKSSPPSSPQSSSMRATNSPRKPSARVTQRSPTSSESSLSESSFSDKGAYTIYDSPRKRKLAIIEESEGEIEDKENTEMEDAAMAQSPSFHRNLYSSPRSASQRFKPSHDNRYEAAFHHSGSPHPCPSYLLPQSLRAAPNIVIHNTVTLAHPSLNPHSSTDAFFSQSASSPPGSNNVRPKSLHRQALDRSEQHPSEDYSTGNDQSPPVRGSKPTTQRPGRDGLVPLIPEYVATQTTTITNLPGDSLMAEKRSRSDPFPMASTDEEEMRNFDDASTKSFSSACGDAQLLDLPNCDKPSDAMEGLQHIDKFVVQSYVDTFQYVMWPLIPLPAAVLSEESVDWYMREGRTRNTKLTLYTNMAQYYAAVCGNNIASAQELFHCLVNMIPHFYDEQDTTVALVLIMMGTCTFSWYDADDAMSLSRDFLNTAITMCESLGQRNSEIYHMGLDVRSWIEGGRLTPSLHARFPLHSNDYPTFLLPCRVAIKQCFHLVSMVRHIVFILEHAPRGTVLPPSARADVDEKLVLLKACYSNMSCAAMQGHPFLARYIKLMLVGSMAELRLALGETSKALTKAILFVELCENVFPMVEVVFYASKVFDILLAAHVVEHCSRLISYAEKYAALKDVASFIQLSTKKLENRASTTSNNTDAAQKYLVVS